MIHKTRGIVFRFTKYGETSIIVTIFTEDFGLQSYIVNGVRSKSAKNKIALYQPLTLLSLVVYRRANTSLERIKEIACLHPYRSLMADVKKATLAMFINELLNKTVKDESHAGEVFRFVHDALIALDAMAAGYENFHLLFMIRLARFLGFGVYNVDTILGGRIVDRETEKILEALLTGDDHARLAITNIQRRNVLQLLLRFYAEHIENLGEIKSVQVLREVFA